MHNDIVVAAAASIDDHGVCSRLFRPGGLGRPTVEVGELFGKIPVRTGGKLYFEWHGSGSSGGR